MAWSRSFKLGVLVLVVFLVTIQFLAFPSNRLSNPSPMTIPSKTWVHQSEDTPQTSVSIVTRWILSLWSLVVSDGRSVFESKQRTEVLLLLRKLVVFSVREVNQRLEGTPCAKWWANPLSVTEFEEKQISPSRVQYNVTFRVHPGGIPFESLVLVYRPIPSVVRPFPASELTFLAARRQDRFPSASCPNLTLDPELAMLCLCPEEKAEADKVTAIAREEWSKQDPELPTWPPDVSMSVPDYIRLYTMDLYLKSPSNKTAFCGPEVKMLLFISSAPTLLRDSTHLQHRKAIRNSFGNFKFLEENGARLVFLFGIVANETLQSEIDQEHIENDDIVQADFMDSYHNLTLSHLSMYNWVVTYCRSRGAPMPSWLFKADDDFFLNVPLARRITDANPDTELIGVPFCGTKAIRSIAYITKYYVPRYMYAPDYYAGYLSGVAYLVRTDVLEPLLNASNTTPIIHMDDAYVMGLLTREVGIRPQNSPLISYGKGDNLCDIRKTMSTYITNTTLREMWIQFQGLTDEECPLEDISTLKITNLSDYDQKACLYK